MFFFLLNEFSEPNCRLLPIACPSYLESLGRLSNNQNGKGLTLVQALWGRVGAKGCWRIFFKNPTTQLRVVWGLTEKKCEQTPKFACFSV